MTPWSLPLLLRQQLPGSDIQTVHYHLGRLYGSHGTFPQYIPLLTRQLCLQIRRRNFNMMLATSIWFWLLIRWHNLQPSQHFLAHAWHIAVSHKNRATLGMAGYHRTLWSAISLAPIFVFKGRPAHLLNLTRLTIPQFVYGDLINLLKPDDSASGQLAMLRHRSRSMHDWHYSLWRGYNEQMGIFKSLDKILISQSIEQIDQTSKTAYFVVTCIYYYLTRYECLATLAWTVWINRRLGMILGRK